jgi:hypothetical protein
MNSIAPLAEDESNGFNVSDEQAKGIPSLGLLGKDFSCAAW